jgi:DNA-damage-inducible protein J
MATLQIRVDDNLKASVDSLFSGLGLDTPTAVRMFFAASLDHNGLPFEVRYKERKPTAELLEAMEDVRLRRNLHGPFETVDDAMKALLED